MSVNYIFLSGWGIDKNVWQPVANSLPNTVIADWSDEPTALLTPDTILIAWSFGGLSAIDWCYRLPMQCQKLILIASTPKFLQTPDWLAIESVQAQKFTRQLTTNFAKGMRRFQHLVSFPNGEILSGLLSSTINSDHLLKQLHTLWQIDYREQYFALRLPIIQIWGAQDAILPIAATTVLHQHPTATNYTIAKGGHAPFLTHPALFMQLLLNEI